MPKVHGIALSPFVRKVRVALAEKNIAYDVDPVVPLNVSAEYRRISPLGKIPAYTDGDKALADSSVICAYLERLHPAPSLYPVEAYAYARALWFEEYADAGLVPVAGGKIFYERVIKPGFFQQPADEAVVQQALEVELPPMFDYLESQLAPGARHFVGDVLTIGDIAIGSVLVNLQHAGVTVDTSRWPCLAAAVDATLARPSFQLLIAEENAMLGR